MCINGMLLLSQTKATNSRIDENKNENMFDELTAYLTETSSTSDSALTTRCLITFIVDGLAQSLTGVVVALLSNGELQVTHYRQKTNLPPHINLCQLIHLL